MSEPNLEGVLAPIHEESDFTSRDGSLEIVGDVPRGLRGSYWRNGPNTQFPPLGRYHLWDGDGMLHVVDFDDLGVSYRNRWIRTPALEVEREYGRALFGGMLDMRPPPDELEGLAEVNGAHDNNDILQPPTMEARPSPTLVHRQATVDTPAVVEEARVKNTCSMRPRVCFVARFKT